MATLPSISITLNTRLPFIDRIRNTLGTHIITPLHIRPIVPILREEFAAAGLRVPIV